MNKERIFVHKATGVIYEVINDNIIDATNASDGQRMVLYFNRKKNLSFVRSHKEFYDGRFVALKEQ